MLINSVMPGLITVAMVASKIRIRSLSKRRSAQKKIVEGIGQNRSSRLLVVCLVSVLVSPVSTEDTNCDTECFVFGPTRKTDITLYHYPRDVEEAVQVCRDQNGWLFTEYSVGTLENWLSLVHNNWGPLFQSTVDILTDAVLLSRQGEDSQFDVRSQVCPDRLLVNHTDSSRYRVSGGILAQLVPGEKEILEAFGKETHLSFICAVEGGGCPFSKMSDTYIPDGAVHRSPIIKVSGIVITDFMECMQGCQVSRREAGNECWFFAWSREDNVCLIYYTAEPLTDTNITETKENWDLYIKECFEPSVNFEKNNTAVEPEEYFNLEKYCDIIPSVDPYNGCPLTEEQEELPATRLQSLEPSTSAVLGSSPGRIEPTPSSSYSVSEAAVTTSVMATSTDTVDLAVSQFSLEPSYSVHMAATLMTPADRTPVEMTPTEQMLTALSSGDIPSTEMTQFYATPEMNATEVSMRTTTSVANVSSTATIVATECDCTCIIHVTSTRDRQEFMSSIIHDLEIDKKNISKHKRKYKSVNRDRRWQTLSMGYLGLAILLLIFGGILLMDLGTIIHDISMMLHNIRDCWGHGREERPDVSRVLSEPDRQQILQGDLERYLAMAAEVCPTHSLYQRPPRQRIRQYRDNRDKHNPFVGLPRAHIYNSN